MYLARIKGTAVAAAKHDTLRACRFLVAQRMEADGSLAAEPIVVLDWLGAAKDSIVVVSTDGDIAWERFGSNTPARLTVIGILDAAHAPGTAAGAGA